MRKKDLEQMRTILKLVDKKVTNNDLAFYIRDNIEIFLDPDFKRANNTRKPMVGRSHRGISISYDGKCFEISFEPSMENFNRITTYFSDWKDNTLQSREVDFDGEEIHVTERKSSERPGINGSPAYIRKETKQRDYRNNLLTHEYLFTSETHLNIFKKEDFSVEQETFVNDERQAVRRTNCVADKDALYVQGLRFHKTDYFDELPFNTRETKPDTHICKLHEITEREYDNFTTLLKVKQKGRQKVITK